MKQIILNGDIDAPPTNNDFFVEFAIKSTSIAEGLVFAGKAFWWKIESISIFEINFGAGGCIKALDQRINVLENQSFLPRSGENTSNFWRQHKSKFKRIYCSFPGWTQKVKFQWQKSRFRHFGPFRGGQALTKGLGLGLSGPMKAKRATKLVRSVGFVPVLKFTQMNAILLQIILLQTLQICLPVYLLFSFVYFVYLSSLQFW